MQQFPPASPGMPEADIDTPALLIDLDAFEANLDRMATLLSPTKARLRGHAKTHKSPVIARLQIAHGAIGQCVQKVSEAEALAWGGIPDILVSNEVVSKAKLARLAALTPLARVAVCVDDPSEIRVLDDVAEAARTRLSVLVEIDVGAGRCGCPPGLPAGELARQIAASPHLRFLGLQAYHGSAQHIRKYEERKAAAEAAIRCTELTIEELHRRKLDCPIVGGGGTGSFMFEATSNIYNEIQAGSYCFMDADYGRDLDANGAPVTTFSQSLFVLTSVMSRPRSGFAVVDAGHKAVAVDSGLPLVWKRPSVQYVGSSDEHGNVSFGPESSPLVLGEKLRLVPGHCDPTVDLYDWYVGVRDGRVECLWPITARGGLS